MAEDGPKIEIVSPPSWWQHLPIDEQGRPVVNGEPMVEIRPGVWQTELTISLENYLQRYVVTGDFSGEITGTITVEGAEWAERLERARIAASQADPREEAFKDWWEGVEPWTTTDTDIADMAHEAFCAGVEWEQNRE